MFPLLFPRFPVAVLLATPYKAPLPICVDEIYKVALWQRDDPVDFNRAAEGTDRAYGALFTI